MAYFPKAAAYYDADRGKYLEDNVATVDYYLDATSRKNQWMYNIPGVSSNDAPFVVVGQQVIVGVECVLRDEATGDVITLKDENGLEILTITLNNELSYVNNDLDIDVSYKKLSSWVNGILINVPTLRIHLKKIYIP